MTPVRTATVSPDHTHTVDASRPERTRPLLTAVVPVYNGGEAIVANVSSIQRTLKDGLPGEDVEVVVVSDGSIDDTGERLLAARADAGVRVIHYDRNLGKGYAVKAGALASHGEWIALVDADLDLDPASVPDYVEVARSERLDFAIGSKRHPDSLVHYPLSRRIASRSYQLLNRVLFRLDVRDTQVGLKVFSRAVVEDVFPLLLVKRFAFDLELLAVARALGHGRVRELPINLQYRFSGSQLRSRAVVRALLDTAAVFYRLRILRTYQRKRHLLRGAAALAPESQPFVTFVGEGDAAVVLDYEELDVVTSRDTEAARTARGELLAILAPGARPAGNWVSAAVPFFADSMVAAVVVPTFAPLRGRVRERVVAAVLESRLGGGSRRSSYFPGNVRVVSDYPADSVVIRRDDYTAAAAAAVGADALVAWLAERGRRTVYTPDASVAAAPPPLILPHLRATIRYARARGVVARRTRGTSLSAATARSLLPLAAAVVGVVLLLIGGSVRTAGLVLVLGLGAALVASGLHAAVRFASPAVGLLEPPSVVATHAAYIAGFLRGLASGK
jgi:glycosyltransferase involved in cell wall biosynthesis